MTNPIDRKTAEAARRKVIHIDAQRKPPRVGDLAVRTWACNVWNEFCQQEQARLDAKDERHAFTVKGMAQLWR